MAIKKKNIPAKPLPASPPKPSTVRKRRPSTVKVKQAYNKQKKIQALRTMVRVKKRRRGKGLFGSRWIRGANSLIVDYLEFNGRLPKIDSFNKLKPGALVKVLHETVGRTARPRTREGASSYEYLLKILVNIPQDSHLMLVKRHPKFPEWYNFLILGDRSVWVDISEYVDCLSIMKKPVSKKK